MVHSSLLRLHIYVYTVQILQLVSAVTTGPGLLMTLDVYYISNRSSLRILARTSLFRYTSRSWWALCSHAHSQTVRISWTPTVFVQSA